MTIAPERDRAARSAAASPARAWSPTRGETRWAFALGAGALSALVVWAVWRVFVGTELGQRVDTLALDGAKAAGAFLVEPLRPLLGVVSETYLLIVMVVGSALLFAQRRWADAARVIVLVMGASVTTQVVKASFLYRPDFDLSTRNTLPSGHTTAAATVAAVLLLVAPRPLRPLAALVGAGYTVATGIATTVVGWHRPSDVIAGIAVVAAWSLLVMVPNGATTRAPRGPDGGRGASYAVLGLIGGASLLLALGAFALAAIRVGDLPSIGGWSPTDAIGIGLQGAAFVAGSTGIVVAACVSAMLQLAARR